VLDWFFNEYLVLAINCVKYLCFSIFAHPFCRKYFTTFNNLRVFEKRKGIWQMGEGSNWIWLFSSCKIHGWEEETEKCRFYLF